MRLETKYWIQRVIQRVDSAWPGRCDCGDTGRPEPRQGLVHSSFRQPATPPGLNQASGPVTKGSPAHSAPPPPMWSETWPSIPPSHGSGMDASPHGLCIVLASYPSLQLYPIVLLGYSWSQGRTARPFPRDRQNGRRKTGAVPNMGPPPPPPAHDTCYYNTVCMQAKYHAAVLTPPPAPCRDTRPAARGPAP